MPVNDIITVNEYNNIRNKVLQVMSTGSGNFGYGQPIRSSGVTTTSRVTINEWANLRNDIINAHVHQTGSAPSIVTVNEGNTVRYSTVDAPVTTYDQLADNLITNRFNVGAGQSAVSVPAGSPSSTTWPGPYGNFWSSKIECTISISWPDSNLARFFFNSGGQIRITSSRSGGSGTSQNTAWTSILSTAGTVSFGGNNPGTGTLPSDGTNWYRLTNFYQPYFSTSGSSPYGSNTYRISARCVEGASNQNGTASTGLFYLEYIDNYVDPGTVIQPGESQARNPADFPPGDAVDGTFTVAVDLIFATGVLVPAGFGNFSVVLPSVGIGAIRTP